MSLLVHKDDDSNDLSDLGIGTSSDKSSVSEDYANDDNHSVVRAYFLFNIFCDLAHMIVLFNSLKYSCSL